MSTTDFITELFCRIDDQMKGVRQHSHATLAPSEIVPLAALFALKGGSGRAFYRWLNRDYHALFPTLPERTRLFRLFTTHRTWADRFLAEPTILGAIDSYGIELIHPRREGRSSQQIGRKGVSNHRWIVGAKLCVVINQYGRVVDWDCDGANVHDTQFQPLITRYDEQMIILGDGGFHAKTGDPANLKLCRRGVWNDRYAVELVFALLTTVCHSKKMLHRSWAGLRTRLAFTVALFNLLVGWQGLKFDTQGRSHLALAQFGL